MQLNQIVTFFQQALKVGLDHDVISANDDLDDLPLALVLVERREDFEKLIEVERAIAETDPPLE